MENEYTLLVSNILKKLNPSNLNFYNKIDEELDKTLRINSFLEMPLIIRIISNNSKNSINEAHG